MGAPVSGGGPRFHRDGRRYRSAAFLTQEELLRCGPNQVGNVNLSPLPPKRPKWGYSPPSWGRTRPVTPGPPAPSIPVGSKRLELGFPEGALHSYSESSAVEPGEGQMGNVGLTPMAPVERESRVLSVESLGDALP